MEEKNWLAHRFAPRILVSSTFDALELCLRSQQTIASYLSHASDIVQPISINSISNIINFDTFRLKLIDSFDKNANRLDAILEQTAPNIDWTVRPTEELRSNEQTPWFTAWSNKYVETLDYQPHELIQMPVAFVYVASVSDQDPTRALQLLCRPQSLPKIYQNNEYYSAVPSAFLLIHDGSEAQALQAESMTRELKSTFKDAVVGAVPVVASEDITSAIHAQMHNFLSNLLIEGIAPFLEKKLVDLYGLIA